MIDNLRYQFEKKSSRSSCVRFVNSRPFSGALIRIYASMLADSKFPFNFVIFSSFTTSASKLNFSRDGFSLSPIIVKLFGIISSFNLTAVVLELSQGISNWHGAYHPCSISLRLISSFPFSIWLHFYKIISLMVLSMKLSLLIFFSRMELIIIFDFCLSSSEYNSPYIRI